VPASKAGFKVPLLIARFARLALVPDSRVTVIEYVWVVTPSPAVTTVLMVVELPTAPKAILPDAVPEVTVTPFTFIVAVGSCAVGVTVTDAMPLVTAAVYAVVPPTESVRVSGVDGVSAMLLSEASEDALKAPTARLELGITDANKTVAKNIKTCAARFN
jgi:hypothetical protein